MLLNKEADRSRLHSPLKLFPRFHTFIKHLCVYTYRVLASLGEHINKGYNVQGFKYDTPSCCSLGIVWQEGTGLSNHHTSHRDGKKYPKVEVYMS